jgi:hypothetical protein
MTRQEAKELLPVIQAFADGKEVEYNLDGKSHWVRLISSSFGEGASAYRIKPEPKLRPWRPEEVPVGAVFRYKNNPDAGRWQIVAMARGEEAFLCGGARYSEDGGILLSMAFDQGEFSTDFGRTWSPCGIID